MKTGLSVIIDCPEDKNNGRKGITTLTGSYHSTVMFYDDKKCANVPNKFLKPCSHVSRPNIESEALGKIGKEIRSLIREIQAMQKATELHLEHSRKYQTDWARATATALFRELQDKQDIVDRLNSLLGGAVK